MNRRPDEIEWPGAGPSVAYAPPDDDALPSVDGVELQVVTVRVFAGTEEAGATALVGDGDEVLIPEGGDVMFYGDGGAGKTTLAIDLACHLAAGENWLGFPVGATATVLLVENEGPRPLFRRKLARKLDGWAGGDVGDRIHVLEDPWAALRLPEARDLLAAQVHAHEVDVLIVGPLTRFGMDEAGTLRDVAEFMQHVAGLRRASGRRLTVVLIHHENKGGKVSGAWEGSGDTLFHVQAQGNGHTRLHVQKARWSPGWHQTTHKLRWAGGQGYELEDAEPPRPERVWGNIAEYVLANGGCSWNDVERAVAGEAGYKRRRREQMLEAGELLNVGRGRAFLLWHRDDPARPTLNHAGASEDRRTSDAPASHAGDEGEGVGASVRRRLIGDAPTDAPTPASPAADDAA